VAGNGKAPMQLAPRTIFNVGITSSRSFATASIPFAPARAVAKAAGGSFNDVVLWICATALRRYLAAHGSVPRTPLVAAMPVSLREDSNKELNNQASMSLVQLGTHLADPRARMQAIMQSTGKVKSALAGLKSVLPTDYPSLLAPWLVGGAGRLALKAYGRSGVAERLPALANLAISNVPGPQVPLYLAGARMLTFHPLSIILHGLALNITVQTYAGRVDFGLIADPLAAPRLQELADGLEQAFAEAVQVFGDVPAAAPAPASVPAPARKRRKAPARTRHVPAMHVLRAA
jgi:diacylglycerol O-acyltransferase